MKIILYVKTAATLSGMCGHMYSSLSKKAVVEVCHTLDCLESGLMGMADRRGIVILIASDSDELEDIVTCDTLFEDIRLIVVLPDRNPETIEKGYKLHPRFLTFLENGFNNVVAVVEKMMGKTLSHNMD